MRKTFVWALMAALVVTGSAFAARPGFEVRPNETYLTGAPATTNNDDSCDIGVRPAATLLLPYFEVDIDSAAGTGETTIFTITNVSQLPQVAHVTLWTDYSFPVIDFNIFLTGYDVQSINLYDIIVRGRIAPDDGTGLDVSNVGELSGDVDDQEPFDNPVVTEESCVDLPVRIPDAYVTRMQQAFTAGTTPSLGGAAACRNIGGVHDNAVGYATVDVAGACTPSLPTDAIYFSSEIRYDNVLVGDYQQVNGDEEFAQGNPMVHILAIPEGGLPGDFPTNFDNTFYSRYQPTQTATNDRRQPLPALFAARWISSDDANDFQTFFKVWREGPVAEAANCSGTFAQGNTWILNGFIGITELVRFDEEENPETLAPDIIISPPIESAPTLPETSLADVTDEEVFPENTEEAIAGWMYMNLDSGDQDPFATQNWVVVSMRAQDTFSVDFDAAWLGNGCTPPVGQSEAVDETGDPIGPAGGLFDADDNPDPNFNPDLVP